MSSICFCRHKLLQSARKSKLDLIKISNKIYKNSKKVRQVFEKFPSLIHQIETLLICVYILFLVHSSPCFYRMKYDFYRMFFRSMDYQASETELLLFHIQFKSYVHMIDCSSVVRHFLQRDRHSFRRMNESLESLNGHILGAFLIFNHLNRLEQMAIQSRPIFTQNSQSGPCAITDCVT